MIAKPPFDTLEPLPGHPEYRLVAGSWMGRDEYEICGWHVVGEYTENGKPQRYWKAELAGLQRYGQIREARRSERREAWKEREAQEDEFTAYINALDDAKPQR